MQNKRYCTKCNSELEILEIDGHPYQVCKSCSCIEPGYVESEKEIVLELQDYFKSELWRVMFVMGIFRAHLTKRALDTLCCEEEGCKEPAVMYYCETHAP